MRSFVTSVEFSRRFGLGEATSSAGVGSVAIDGLTVFVPEDDWAITRALTGSHDYEPHVWRQLERALEPGRDFVDVGANLGLLALRAARRLAPHGRVLAIEASPRNCALMLRSAQANELTNIEILPVAAGDRRGIVGYVPHGSNGEVVSMADAASAQADMVAMLPLDDLVPSDADVAVMKIDVEGAEPVVLAGAARLIERCRPVVIFELSPEAMRVRTGVDAEALLAPLVERGYEIRRLARDDEPSGRQPEFSTSVSEILTTLAGFAEPFDMMARPRG